MLDVVWSTGSALVGIIFHLAELLLLEPEHHPQSLRSP
jgi:hypothetical protein